MAVINQERIYKTFNKQVDTLIKEGNSKSGLECEFKVKVARFCLEVNKLKSEITDVIDTRNEICMLYSKEPNLENPLSGYNRLTLSNGVWLLHSDRIIVYFGEHTGDEESDKDKKAGYTFCFGQDDIKLTFGSPFYYNEGKTFSLFDQKVVDSVDYNGYSCVWNGHEYEYTKNNTTWIKIDYKNIKFDIKEILDKLDSLIPDLKSYLNRFKEDVELHFPE